MSNLASGIIGLVGVALGWALGYLTEAMQRKTRHRAAARALTTELQANRDVAKRVGEGELPLFSFEVWDHLAGDFLAVRAKKLSDETADVYSRLRYADFEIRELLRANAKDIPNHLRNLACEKAKAIEKLLIEFEDYLGVKRK